jgi:hypothetical protein
MNTNFFLQNLNVIFLIPSFHVNAHVMKCVTTMHPKLFPSVGTIDGEDLERIWSQLGNFSYIVRNMTVQGRRHQLEDALLDQRRRRIKALRPRLIKKKKRMEFELQIKKDVFNSLKPDTLTIIEFEDRVKEWLSEKTSKSTNLAVTTTQQIKAFINAQYRLLKSRQHAAGQVYLQAILKGIRKAKNLLNRLIFEEDHDDSMEPSTDRKDVCVEAFLDQSRTQAELCLLSQEIARLDGGDSDEEQVSLEELYEISLELDALSI